MAKFDMSKHPLRFVAGELYREQQVQIRKIVIDLFARAGINIRKPHE